MDRAYQDPEDDVSNPGLDIIYIETDDNGVNTVTAKMILADSLVEDSMYYFTMLGGPETPHAPLGVYQPGGVAYIMYSTEGMPVFDGIYADGNTITWIFDHSLLPSIEDYDILGVSSGDVTDTCGDPVENTAAVGSIEVPVGSGGSGVNGDDDDPVDSWTFTFDGDSFDVVGPGENASGTFTLNTGSSPKQIDLLISEHSNHNYEGEACLGIYELSGDSLKVALNEPGNPNRPSSFDAIGSSRVWQMTKTQSGTGGTELDGVWSSNGGGGGSSSGLAYRDPAKDVREKGQGEGLDGYPFVDILYLEAVDNGVDSISVRMVLAAPPMKFCEYHVHVNKWGAMGVFSGGDAGSDKSWIQYGEEKVHTGISYNDRNITWILDRSKLMVSSGSGIDEVESLNGTTHYWCRSTEFNDICDRAEGSTESPVGSGPASGGYGFGSGIALQDPSKDVVEQIVNEPLEGHPGIDILYLEALDNGVDIVTVKMVLAAEPVDNCNYNANVNMWGAQCIYSLTDESWIMYGGEKVHEGISSNDRNITWILDRQKVLDNSLYGTLNVYLLNGSSTHWSDGKEFIDICEMDGESLEVPVGTGPAEGGYGDAVDIGNGSEDHRILPIIILIIVIIVILMVMFAVIIGIIVLALFLLRKKKDPDDATKPASRKHGKTSKKGRKNEKK